MAELEILQDINELNNKMETANTKLTEILKPSLARFVGDLYTIGGNKIKSYNIGEKDTVTNAPPNGRAWSQVIYIPTSELETAENGVLYWVEWDSNGTQQMFYNVKFKGVYKGWQQLATIEQINVLENKAMITHGGNWNSVDLNTITDIGVYYFSNGVGHTNTPDAKCKYFILVNYTSHNNYLIQEITDIGGTWKYFRSMVNGAWSDWQQIATTTKTEITVPFNTDYLDDDSTSNPSRITKINNRVEVIINMKKVDNSYFSASNTVPLFTLPSGYRPRSAIRLICASSNPYGSFGSILISTAGNVFLRSTSVSTMKSIMFTVTFEV